MKVPVPKPVNIGCLLSLLNLALSITVFVFLYTISCVKIPPDPNTADNCTMDLILKSSSETTYKKQISDTVGNEIEIAAALKYPEHLEKIKIDLFNEYDSIVFDTILVFSSINIFDTVRFTHRLKVSGKNKFVASAAIDDETFRTDYTVINVLPSQKNIAPVISIEGNRTIVAGDLCTLTVTIKDSNPDQKHLMLVTHKGQQRVLKQNKYLWRVPAIMTSNDTLIFTVTDNGSPPLTATDTVIISIVYKTPETPAVLHVQSRDSATITLSWIESFRALSYIMYKSDDSTTGFSVYHDQITATQFVDSVTSQKQYYYIKAQNSAGISDSSNTISSTDSINTAPTWNTSDTLSITLNRGITYFIDLADSCSDSEHDVINFAILPNSITTDTIQGNRFLITAPDSVTDSFLIELCATDHHGLSDTLRLVCTVSSVTITDSVPPAVTFTNILSDSTVVTQSTVLLHLTVKDKNDILSITCSNDTNSYAVTKTSDSTFTCLITHLTEGEYSKITIQTSDNAIPSNTTTSNIFLTFQPPLIDTIAPTIIRQLPLTDSVITHINMFSPRIICNDISGIQKVTCTAMNKTFFTTKADDSTYTATITGLVQNQFTPITFTAVDASDSSNISTLTIYIKYDPTITDTTGPEISLQTFATDSVKISSSSLTIEVTCTDTSGIASVSCTVGTTSVNVTQRAPGKYSVPITSLSSGDNNIIFTATDASTNANNTTLHFTVIYDPTMTDSSAPVITLKEPATNGERIFDDSATVQITCIDDNGIASVLCTRKGNSVKVMKNNDSSYTVNITKLTPGKSDTITFIATDKSHNENKQTLDVILRYNTVITDIALKKPLDNATNVIYTPSFSWSGGDDPDGDTVYFRVLYDTVATNLSYQTAEITADSVTINPDVVLDPFATYYWQVIAYSKVNNDSSISDIRSFRTKGIAPTITSTPNDTEIVIGETLSLRVTATGIPTPTYQWFHNNVPISKATSATYTKTASSNADSGDYYVTISNGISPDTSTSPVHISILTPPTITSVQPVRDTSVLSSGQIIFSVTAGGSLPLFYQWMKNDVPIPSGTQRLLNITTVSPADNGIYSVTVLNAAGKAKSNPVRFTVITEPVIIE